MSHITKVKTRLKDGVILKQALRKCGYQVEKGGVIVNGYNAREREAVEISARKRHRRLGFRRSASNGNCYEIVADWRVIGKERQGIMKEIFRIYSREKVLKAGRLRGYSVIKNKTHENGKIEIVLRKVA
jgi:hypothetical protein